MKKQGKILLTNINADKDREQSLREYQSLMAAALLNYSTIKLSMNLFTMYEMSEEVSLSSREEIEDYISTDEPYDKAGAYGIQGLFGKFVEKIEGDYNNVVGLPLGLLNSMLESFGVHIL